MRLHRVFPLLLLASGVFLSAQSLPSNAPQPQVEVRISVSKPVFMVGEPIEITALVKNVGTAPFYIRKWIAFADHGEGALIPKLLNVEGQEVFEKYRVGGHSIASGDFAETVEQDWLPLTPGSFYGKSEKRFDGVRLEPGVYTLQVRYWNNVYPWVAAKQSLEQINQSAQKLKHPALLGDHASNVVTFKVAQE